MATVIVYNPNAGKGRGERHAKKLQSKMCDCELFCATSIPAMQEFWAGEEAKRYSKIVLIGGDGTIGPNVDAIIKNGLTTPIYSYGRGTANDFASHFRTNIRPSRAARIIETGKTLEVDTLLVGENSYAVNVASGGAFTNGVTNYSKKAKRRFGKMAYVTKAALQAFTMKSQDVKFTVDDKCFCADIFVFYIANTKNVGGQKRAANLADPSDGLLDLVCVKRCGFFGKLSVVFAKAFGRMSKCKHIIYAQGKNFCVEPVLPVINNFTITDTDGNASDAYPMKVTLGPKMLIIVP